MLREIASHITHNEHSGTTLLTKSRHRVDSDLAERLGHRDLGEPVPKDPATEHDGEPGLHARNILLRALIRAGVVKGGKLER